MRINERELIWFAKSSKRVDAQGYLWKRGVVNTSTKKRWFVLKGNLLFYYKSHEDTTPIGVIILERCRVETGGRLSEADQFEFKLVFDGSDTREYQLAAETEEDMMRWMKLITEASYEYLRAVVSDLRRRIDEEERKLEDKKLAGGEGGVGAPLSQAPSKQNNSSNSSNSSNAVGAATLQAPSQPKPLPSQQQQQQQQQQPSQAPKSKKSEDLNISQDFVDLGAELQADEGPAPVAPPRKSHSHPRP